MSDDVVTRQLAGRSSRSWTLKSLFMAFSLIALIASNVASLVSAGAHEFMHSALLRVLLIGGQPFAEKLLKESPKARLGQDIKDKTADFDLKNKRLAATNELQAKQLEEVNVRNRQLAHQLDVNGKQAKATVATVHQRLKKGVSRNLAALPAESIPYLGLGVTLAVTSLDIYDACQTMKDFNGLLRMMGQGEENPELCGRRVPTVDQVLSSAKTEWRNSVQRVEEESKAIKFSAPEARLPTLDEVTKAVCSVLTVPYFCTVR
jgi:hypothetical protein